ncbi:hypothetical protein B0H10DRAFT_2207112 [Mycena sp. CBHHK59/15]|nr:hypothetical protein B0H10DRAFT_2207112 [Mycena sp. CBHHK59/15]
MPPPEDAESTYAKAVKAELSKDFDSAFRLYIKAAESFLHLSRSVDHEREKSKWKANAGKALERAEKIKAFVEKSKPTSHDLLVSESRLTPVGINYFSPQEQYYTVKKGGIINNRSFLLWTNHILLTPLLIYFTSGDLDGEVALSPEQQKASPVWHRPEVDSLHIHSDVNEDVHGSKRARGIDACSTRHMRLQFNNTSHNPEDEVWVLLTRHVVDTRRTSDFISLRVQLEDDLIGSSNPGDQRTIAIKGTYTNSTHVLARTGLPSQTSGTLSVFASYDGQAPEIGFTLSVYAPASAKIAWDESVPTPPFYSKVEGTLTSKNAGGNSTHPTFMVNPQYHLRIHPPKQASLSAKKANVSMTMQMGRDVPVNISVAWSQGNRIFELSQKDIAASSGAYSYVGDYTVILSTFEPNQMGAFSLEVESSFAFDLKPIPQEGAGMYSKTVRGAWTSQNAMGGPSFKQYSLNPVFELDVQAMTDLKVRLQLLRPKSTAALNVTVFPASASGALGRHIATSGGYDDSIAGVATSQISLGPGKYWLIPSTYNPGFHAMPRA